MKKLSIENVLAELDEKEVFNFYLRPFSNGKYLDKGTHISNPFLTTKQKTPSFNIYPKNGRWYYNDFATADSGDIFELIQILFGETIPEVLARINADFNLGFSDNDQEGEEFNIQHEDWNTSNLAYWKRYQVGLNTLIKFCVRFVVSYCRDLKKHSSTVYKSTINNPAFTYDLYGDGSYYKLYRPLEKKRYKHQYFGRKRGEYVFGYKQLPDKGDRLILTGGEKDVLVLASMGENAISLNSETANPSPELIHELKTRFNEVCILYDLDDTGINSSERIAKQFGLTLMFLPSSLKNEGGKDIADLVALRIPFSIDSLKTKTFKAESSISDNSLRRLICTEEELKKRIKENIVFPDAILNRNSDPIFYPNTINMIQGKAGVFKSRLAQMICSEFLKRSIDRISPLGLNRNEEFPISICYIDTERNLSSQLPFALQEICMKAGYKKGEVPQNFYFTSLIDSKRDEKFPDLAKYIEYVQKKSEQHLFIILDVITDCLQDFNRSEESMKLVDLMNQTINKNDVTFLCIIHENPGVNKKARGHLGTELFNKASTALEINFELDANNKALELIKIDFLKCRSSKKHNPLYAHFDQEIKQLVLANDEEIFAAKQQKKHKAVFDILKDYIERHLEVFKNAVPSTDFIKELSIDLKCAERTIRNRLDEIIENKIEFHDGQSQVYLLTKERTGKSNLYKLVKASVST